MKPSSGHAKRRILRDRRIEPCGTLSRPVAIVRGSERNIKITRPSDLTLARVFLEEERSKRPVKFRIGIGFDLHRLGARKPTDLGGFRNPHERAARRPF